MIVRQTMEDACKDVTTGEEHRERAVAIMVIRLTQETTGGALVRAGPFIKDIEHWSIIESDLWCK